MPARRSDSPPAAPDPLADLLTVWRHWLPHDVPPEIATRVSAALVARGRAADPDGTLEKEILRAEARIADAWITLSDVLPFAAPSGSHAELPDADFTDIEGSCLWVAAWLGSRWGRLMLVIKMLSAGCEQAVIQRHLEITPLASASPVKVLETLRVLDDVIDGYLKSKQSRAQATPTQPADQKPPETSTPLAVGPSMRVLLTRPEPSWSRDDKVLIERYAQLASAIPLRQMPDPDDLASDLLAEFAWFSDLIEGIRVELALAHRLGREHFHLRPILIAGPSGVGKSRFAQRLADLLDIPVARVIGAGSSDSRLLSGTARGWSTATPCLPLVVIRRHLIANPLIVVDELDKAGSGDQNGRLVDTLTAMTDPTVARRWPDECLLADANLSQVTWILLCNAPHRIPATLRARCRIVQVGRPRPYDFDAILEGALRDLASEFDVPPAELPDLPPETIAALRIGFERGRLQPRQLVSLVRRVMAAAAQGERLMARH